MADNKKYYWIKLKTDFFNQREVKKLRKIAGGDTYTIIYLKLQLLSAKADGVIKYDGTEKDLVEQLELELDEDSNNISVTLAFLQANNLIEQISDTNYLLSKACDNIGKEGTSAERVRRHRSKEKALQCNTTETNCNTEKEKEKEKEKELKIELKEKLENKPFSFSLSTTKQLINTNKEYQEKLKAYIDSNTKGLTYEEFFNTCEMKGYKYKNFKLVYDKWTKDFKQQNKTSEKFGGWSE